MRKNSFFKALFFILTAILAGVLIFASVILSIEGPKDPSFPKFMYIYFAFVVAIIIAIYSFFSVFVYRDAQKRGMDCWMWMCIVAFVPNLIGLVIYLVVRNKINEGNRKCINCDAQISDKFKICPYCGADQSMHCPQCGKQTSPDWSTCPYCSNKLK